MADTTPPPALKPADAQAAEEKPPLIHPLTRNHYQRLPVVELQIGLALKLDATSLIARSKVPDKGHPEDLSAEALVYFIRRADRDGDTKTREALFRELLDRCTPFFRGKFRGCDRATREDLQGDVLKQVIDDALAEDDRGDFMQVRFWRYLELKSIDACRKAFNHADNTESLETGYSGDVESEGRSKLESLPDNKLSPEELAMISEGLVKLPPKLRHVFLLRHYFGMKVGDEADADPNEVTLARQFNCTGRTIRNWLKEAGKLLAGFREKQDGNK